MISDTKNKITAYARKLGDQSETNKSDWMFGINVIKLTNQNTVFEDWFPGQQFETSIRRQWFLINNVIIFKEMNTNRFIACVNFIARDELGTQQTIRFL